MRSFMQPLALALATVTLAGATTAWGAPEGPGGVPGGPDTAAASTFSLDDAIWRTRRSSLAMKAAGRATLAARLRIAEAGRPPNPSVTVAHENVGGTLGAESAETSLQIEQSLELGGDRAARRGLAFSMAAIATTRQEELAIELEAETVERFCGAWVLQERLARLGEAGVLAEQAVVAAEERLKAGAAPAFERTQAVTLRSLQEIDRRRVGAELDIARRRLALLWGADSAVFGRLRLPEPVATVLPPIETLHPRVEANPRLRRAAAESGAERWRVREARAGRVPDVRVGAGVRHLTEAAGTGFTMGLSLPLPLWNRQRESVAAAESDRDAAALRERQTVLEVRAELRDARTRFEAALATWEGIRDRVRPEAAEVMRLILAGYRSGRLGYLDVREGQRGLLEADILLIEASADVCRTKQALERIVGAPLDARTPGQEER